MKPIYPAKIIKQKNLCQEKEVMITDKNGKSQINWLVCRICTIFTIQLVFKRIISHEVFNIWCEIIYIKNILQ